MKNLNFVNLMGISVFLLFLSSCLESENPCPDAIINVSVDSTDYTYTITAAGLEEIIYEWRVNGNVVEVEALDDLRDDLLDFTFAPGTYNICISGESEICGGSVEICEEIVIEKNPCPEIEFDLEQISYEKFVFEAETDSKFTWLIDGEVVEMASFGEEEAHKYYHYFEPGTYEICAISTNDCETKSCKEIIVEEKVCSEPSFMVESLEADQWLFTADFDGREDVQYKWYVNGELVDKENFDGIETDHKFLTELSQEEYEVCVIVYSDWCEEIQYCKTISAGEVLTCSSLDFTSERDGDNLAYKFLADFDTKNDITYIWKMYINDDYQGGETREAGSEDDHEFYWQFEKGVNYEVCLKQDGGCEDKQVCKTFIIE